MADYTTADQVLQRFATGHLWLGTIHTSEDEYLAYFDQDNCNQNNLAENSVCGFCQDIGLNDEYYDEDFIIIFPLLKHAIPIAELLETEVPLRDKDQLNQAKQHCDELGIKSANTFVFYSDPTLTIDRQKDYHGLTYIGEFLAEV